MPMTLPAHARVVIVGGGIAGVLDRLPPDEARRRRRRAARAGPAHLRHDVARRRPRRPDARDAQRDADEPLRHRALRDARSARPGLATGWKQCGSVNVAATPRAHAADAAGRWRARAASASSSSCIVAGTKRGERAPLLRTDDLAGAVWIPGDGKANPTDLTQSLAKGARKRGVRIVEGVEVDRRRRAQRPRHAACAGDAAASTATIACEIVVNCAGQWAREFGALAGVNVPLLFGRALLHRHRADRRRARPTLPVMRDPDGYIYYKEEVGGLVMGGFEPVAKPWNVEPHPATLRVPAAAPRTGTSSKSLMTERDASHAVPRDRARSRCC